MVFHGFHGFPMVFHGFPMGKRLKNPWSMIRQTPDGWDPHQRLDVLQHVFGDGLPRESQWCGTWSSSCDHEMGLNIYQILGLYLVY